MDSPLPTNAARVRYARQSRMGWVGPSRQRCKADVDARSATAHRIPWISRYQARPALAKPLEVIGWLIVIPAGVVVIGLIGAVFGWGG